MSRRSEQNFFFKKLPCDPAIPPLGIYPKKTKTLIQKDICKPMLIAALFTIAAPWKQPTCPRIDDWIKKYGAYTHTHTQIFLNP